MSEPTDEEVLGDFAKVRTKWEDLDGQIVALTLAVRLGFPETQPLEAEEVIWVRIVGVESSGIWVEFWAHVKAVHEGTKNPNELCHFFIPYNHIRSVRAQALRKNSLAPTSSPSS